MAPLFSLKRTTRFTLLAFAVLAALPPAFAQSSGSPPYAAARQPGGDPPGRIARLNFLSGAVTTEPAGTDSWSYAAVNRPLTTGDQLWNDTRARSELHIGSTAVRLGESTSLSILNLDDATTQLKVGLGSLSTHVRALPPGTSYEIDTPNLALGIDAPGDYRVDVAPDGASTTVTVRRGSATVYGDAGQFPLSPGQQVTFTGTGLQVAQQSPAPGYDPFDRWAAGRDAAEDRSVSARYVSRDIPGYQDLDVNGTWREDPAYGAMWVPNDVPSDWAPYHTGHWIWQAPWGWTWVDDEPWGFAPYHYGRWAYVDDSWAWVPGPLVVSAPPVYAPALVAFVGGGDDGADWSVSLAVGGAAAAGVAWFPLGPGEPWRPGWGGWSPHYYDRVNRTVVVNNVNITNIHNTYVNYRAPGAITAIPATAFVHGQPVAHFSQHVDPQQWRNARVSPGTPGIAPVRQSFTSGLRAAAYQPPAVVAQRPVVATRNPAVPPAYRDEAAAHLARQGRQVPGAGAPVVKTTPPPDYTPRPVRVPGNPQAGGWAMRNVQLVNPHGPVMQPSHAPREGQPGGAHAGLPGAPQPGLGAASNVPRPATGEIPNGARPMNGAAPGTSGPMSGAMPDARQPANGGATRPAIVQERGVPRPPSPGDAPALRGDARSAPAWMQPHPPLDRQQPATRPSGLPPAAPPAAPAAPPPRARDATMPHPDAAPPPQGRMQVAPVAREAGAAPATRTWPQPRPDYSAPAPQPRPESAAPIPRPHAEYTAPAPRQEYAPPRVNNEYRPPVVHEAPRPQPQPQVQAPRMEPRPQMQAPRVEPRPAPQPPPPPRPAPPPPPPPPRLAPPPPPPQQHAPATPPPPAAHDDSHANRHHE